MAQHTHDHLARLVSLSEENGKVIALVTSNVSEEELRGRLGELSARATFFQQSDPLRLRGGSGFTIVFEGTADEVQQVLRASGVCPPA